MSGCANWGKEDRPAALQSAVLLPEIHLHKQAGLGQPPAQSSVAGSEPGGATTPEGMTSSKARPVIRGAMVCQKARQGRSDLIRNSACLSWLGWFLNEAVVQEYCNPITLEDSLKPFVRGATELKGVRCLALSPRPDGTPDLQPLPPGAWLSDGLGR